MYAVQRVHTARLARHTLAQSAHIDAATLAVHVDTERTLVACKIHHLTRITRLAPVDDARLNGDCVCPDRQA
jgi:hypothetical protein